MDICIEKSCLMIATFTILNLPICFMHIDKYKNMEKEYKKSPWTGKKKLRDMTVDELLGGNNE